MTRQELFDNIRRKGSFLCVGLDPDIRKLPASVREAASSDAEAIERFCISIADATAPYCVAYKPNLAFFESLGAAGWTALEHTLEHIRRNHPDQFIIVDAKRGDIGNTSMLYARSCFEHLGADAVTVAPYMGEDSVTPFLGYPGRWVVLLALTSNKGSHDFQLVPDAEGTPLFERVITTSSKWAGADEMMYVVGATQGAMFADIRRVAPESFLLVPGVGAQGGSLEEVCRHGLTDQCGLLVNSSRGIIYASGEADYAEAAATAAADLAAQMRGILAGAGLL